MQEYDCDWKRRLRQEIITALTGGSAEQIEAFAQVGYYYKCQAPASIYKYFRDDQRNVEAVKSNKLVVCYIIPSEVMPMIVLA